MLPNTRDTDAGQASPHARHLIIFFKTLFKGNNFAFRGVNLVLPEKIEVFAWLHLFRLIEIRGLFSKKNCPKRTFPSDFVKLGPVILYLFLAEKMVVCFICLFVCLFVCLLQYFVRFWLTFL